MSKKNTLVLGASLNSDRYSNMAILRLCENAIEVKAFGMKKGTVCGIEIATEFTALSKHSYSHLVFESETSRSLL